MALAIDSTSLADNLLLFTGSLGSRYHVYRACAHATVVNERSLRERLSYARGIDLAATKALEWQADQDEDLDEAEVIHHLHQQAKSSPVFGNAFSRTERSDAITTLVTSCSMKSPLDLVTAQGRSLSSIRPLSSFRRLSIRQSMFTCPVGFCTVEVSTLEKIIPTAREWLFTVAPKIIGEGRLSERFDECVVWHMQFDIVDLLSPRRLSTWRPGKRRRKTINPFHQMPAPPEQDASPGHHPTKAKRFKGVRYRPERRTWTAEMKPPKSKHKVSFEEFKSQAQAARAIDAAFHYYDKPHLNFPDTLGILSTRPSPAGVLDEEDKLRFVKEQVKWLASMASTLPSSPPLVSLEIPESSSRGCNVDSSGFRTVCEMASFPGVADESYDGTSQPLPSLRPDAPAEFEGHGLLEPPVEGVVAMMGSLDEHQGMLEWSLEDAHVAPSSSCRWSPGSSVQITPVVDESSAPALMNSAEPSCESQDSWMNYLAMFPPASMLPLPPLSPSSFHADVTHDLLESFGGGD